MAKETPPKSSAAEDSEIESGKSKKRGGVLEETRIASKLQVLEEKYLGRDFENEAELGTYLKNTFGRDIGQFRLAQGATKQVCLMHSNEERRGDQAKLAISQEGCGDFLVPLRYTSVAVPPGTALSARLADTGKSLATRLEDILEMGSGAALKNFQKAAGGLLQINPAKTAGAETPLKTQFDKLYASYQSGDIDNHEFANALDRLLRKPLSDEEGNVEKIH